MTESYLCETNPEFEKMLQKFVGGADISKRRMRSHNKKAIYKSKMKKKFNRVSDFDGTEYSSYYPIYMEHGTLKNPRKNPYPKRYWTGNSWFKNYSNRKIRRNKEEFYGKGNHYRKEFDYKWTID